MIFLSLGIGFILGVFYAGHIKAYIELVYAIGAGSALGVAYTIVQKLLSYFSEPRLVFGDRPLVNKRGTYFLRVYKQGSGTAKNCEAILTVLGTNRGEVPTVWEHQNALGCEI